VKFQPYNQQASTVFVCRGLPQTAREADVTAALASLFPDQAIKVKWLKSSPSHGGSVKGQMAALQLQRATNIEAIVGRLGEQSGDADLTPIHFNVWLDTTSCGICKRGGHQTFDCQRLEHS
jgi:hypothetical protein